MRFNVPQFIDVEDRIVWQFSLKQFLFLIGVGAVIMVLWYLFKLWFALLIGVPLVTISLAFLLVKINGRPLTSVFSAWFTFRTNPRLYTWRKEEKND